MCFSATASFTASALLAFLGILAIKKAHRQKNMLFFAATPFIFAIQQFCEGLIWISVPTDPNGILHNIATYAFLFFAFLFWPLWIPIAAGFMEKSGWRKNVCHFSLLLGMLFSLFSITQMAQYSAWSTISECHITYPTYGSADNFSFTSFIYLCAILMPLFASSIRYAWLLAIAIAGSLAMSIVWYSAHVVSVWCFFAALISGVTLFLIDAHTRNIDHRKKV